MMRKESLCHTGLALITFTTLFTTPARTNAVVSCKMVGVPKGCVAPPVGPVTRCTVVTPGICARELCPPLHPDEPRLSGQSCRPT